MKDAEYERERGRLRGLVEKWIGPLGLRWWKVHVEYADDRREFEVEGSKEGALARTHADWRYMEATVKWNMPLLVEFEMSDEALELVFVHEMAHVLVNEMRWDDDEKPRDHEERVCTALAQAFLWVRAVERTEKSEKGYGV